MFGLTRLEREVTTRGVRVRTDAAALNAARRQLSTSVRRELARPRTLLILLAAGLGVGWLRRIGDRSSERRSGDHSSQRPEESEVAEKTGRLAKAMAAVMAGVKIYEQARRAAQFVERHAEPRPPSEPPQSTAQRAAPVAAARRPAAPRGSRRD